MEPNTVNTVATSSISPTHSFTCWTLYLYLESLCPQQFTGFRQQLFYCFNLLWRKQIETHQPLCSSSWTPLEILDCISRLQEYMKQMIETVSPLPLWQNVTSFVYPQELIDSWNSSLNNMSQTRQSRILIWFQLPKEDIPFLKKTLHVTDPLLCVPGWNTQTIASIQYCMDSSSSVFIKWTTLKPKRIRTAGCQKKYMNVGEPICMYKSLQLNLVIDFIPVHVTVQFSH